ncbi:TlpA family protein disulfide reductase [Sphingobacterium sp. SGG-5]|uniref:TlpA family protein disulfide reductase n=1 Tax=Sphingobacterium sp. SGG-5 TaxID=2710881 RepID=UPI0013EDDF86|nr:TlpA disulfide reductase family protein [Sphingobacterium sp. SGG-5]NGM60883.1 TlpA family protein disulfide reductase [Sphingobacterium sp. SGG-5]
MKVFFIYLLILLPSVLMAQSKEDLIEQIKANPKDQASIRLIQRINMQNPDYKELEVLYKMLDKKVRKTTEGKYLQHYIQSLEKSSPGKKAPGITQFDVAGEPYGLQNLKGKYVLVSFWASWNKQSRDEIPAFKTLYNSFKNKNFEILAVSFDSDFAAWKKYITDNALGWKHISDLQNMNNGAALTYGIKSIPQNVLVDPDGIIIARNLRGAELESKLRELLK